MSKRRCTNTGPNTLPALTNIESILIEALSKKDGPAARSYAQMHAAIAVGDVGNVQRLLQSGGKIVNEFKHGKIASLHLASYFCHIEIVRILLENGANANATDNCGNSSLHYLCKTGSVDSTVEQLKEKYCHRKTKNRKELMKLLIDRRVVIDRKNDNGETALHIAAGHGYVEMVKLLISANPPANMTTRELNSGLTPLDLACTNGHLEVVLVLLDNKADINGGENSRRRVPLMCAVEEGHTSIVEILLERGADITVSDLDGKTALYTAAARGYETIVDYLLKKGANVNTELQITNCEKNKLMFGGPSSFKSSDMNDMNAQPPNLLTPLLAAVAEGHETVVRMLIEKGSSVNAADTDGVTALHIAAKRGITTIVKLLIEAGAEVNIVRNAFQLWVANVSCKLNNMYIGGHWTALMAAASGGHLDIVRILIDSKAGVNTRFDDGSTALHFAAEYGHRQIVRTLLKSGSEVDLRNHSEMTPLAVAAKKGNTKIVHTLLKKTAYGETGRFAGENTPLWHAVNEKHTDIFKLIIEYNDVGLVNQADFYGMTLLHLASAIGNKFAVRMLVKHGSKVNIDVYDVDDIFSSIVFEPSAFLEKNREQRFKAITGMTSLHLASVNQHTSIVKFLIKNGADVNHPDSDNCLPLWYACDVGSAEVAKLLIEGGAHVTLKYDDQTTLLEHAVYSGLADVVKELAKGGADVNHQRPDGFSLLALACQTENAYVVRSLLENIDNVDVFDKHGYTPLAYSASAGLAHIVQLIVDKGADINAQNAKGETPLILAACRGHVETVKTLVECGANVDETDKQNRTALERAAYNGHMDIVNFLSNDQRHRQTVTGPPRNRQLCNTDLHYVSGVKEAATLVDGGLDVSAPNIHGSQPLHCAAKAGQPELSQFFIKQGASVHATDCGGNTPLHEAANVSVIKILVASGASVNTQNRHGKSPLHIAMEIKREDIAVQLLQNGANIEIADHWMNTPFHYLSYDSIVRNEHIRNTVANLIKWRHGVLASTNVFGVSLFMHLRSYFDEKFGARHPSHLLTARSDENGTDRLGNTELHRIVGVYGATNSFMTHEPIHLQSRVLATFEWTLTFDYNVSSEDGEDLAKLSRVNINTSNMFGQTPLQVARGFEAIVACLEHRGCKLDESTLDSRRRNCWHLWTQRDNAENLLGIIISKLLSSNTAKNSDVYGALRSQINQGDDMGRTALHYASMSRSNKLIELVASLTDDINSPDLDGRTPLHYAAIYGKTENVNLLLKKGCDEERTDIYAMEAKHYIQLQIDHTSKANQCKHSCFAHSKNLLTNVHEAMKSLRSSHRAGIIKEIRKNRDGPEFIWDIWINRQCNFYHSPTSRIYWGISELVAQLLPRDLDPVRAAMRSVIDGTVKNIIKRIAYLDPRFTGECIPVGSIYEETKIDCYDEFDYTICLQKFSKFCQVLSDSRAPVGFVFLKCENKPIDVKYDEFIAEDKLLNTRLVKAVFEMLLKRVLTEADFLSSISHLGIVDVVTENDAQYSFSTEKVYTNVKLRYVKPVKGQFVFHDVSVDIVPAVYIKNWWPENGIRTFNQYITDDGCYLVLDQPQRKFPNRMQWSAPHARVCFSVLESGIIRQSPPVVKAAYIVAKQMVKNFSDMKVVSSYVVKSAVLHCMQNDEDLKACHGSNYDEITKEQLSYWVQRIMRRLLCFVLQDFVPSVFMPDFVLPVCEFEQSFKFSHTRLQQYKLTYRDFSPSKFCKQNRDNIMCDSQLRNIIKAYLSCHLMYWSTLPENAQLRLHFPPIDPDVEKTFELDDISSEDSNPSNCTHDTHDE